MSKAEQKVAQYLQEAHATEMSLVAVLQSQIAMTPRGSYRQALEEHLEETRDHARRVRERSRELGQGSNPLQAMIGLTETVIGQSLAFGKVPLDLLRGTGGEEKVLKNAKDAAATEALEIATYTALERLAKQVSDDETAKLAASIRADEERMLERVLREIPRLADSVVGAEIEGRPSYDPAQTGAADAARSTARQVKRATRQTARRTSTAAKRTARQARKVPGAAQAEDRVRGAVAGEPWPGYDELNASAVEAALREADDERARAVAAYERSHKNRAGVLRVARRENAAQKADS